ncbi:transporter substrate-binding domain-containing protein [Renibacterium salmoninarum]|uniref:transporter substrate-binding domain-containing protein n=1 Tax=Renibacterium salmoninarum TaxID=1646 RepID=UPI0003254DA2|nr:transporter substrate-binding domain-containing protein [Renibacterium salmoninarum]
MQSLFRKPPGSRLFRTKNPVIALIATVLTAVVVLFGTGFFGMVGANATNATNAAVVQPQTVQHASVQGKTFTIGADTTFAPFEFRDSGGGLVGIDMDLVRAIAKDQGFNVEIKSLGFSAALQALISELWPGRRRHCRYVDYRQAQTGL